MDISSPQNKDIRAQAWKVLERLKQEGKARHIGVSNFTVAHLEELLSVAVVPPEVNQVVFPFFLLCRLFVWTVAVQVEFHPLLFQRELLEFCKQHSIVLEAYSSLGQVRIAFLKFVLCLDNLFVVY
jgi:diketogulonate reductase-like aldo/keto reductase